MNQGCHGELQGHGPRLQVPFPGPSVGSGQTPSSHRGSGVCTLQDRGPPVGSRACFMRWDMCSHLGLCPQKGI